MVSSLWKGITNKIFCVFGGWDWTLVPPKKVDSKRERRERVYKRAAWPFSENETQRNERAGDFCKKSRRKRYAACGDVAAEEGFEPSQTESESVVLPLHNPAILCPLLQAQDWLYQKCGICQESILNFFLPRFSRWSAPPLLCFYWQGGERMLGFSWR